MDNTGAAPLRFMLALHTYFRVADIGQTRVDGLDGCASWDSLVDIHSHHQGAIHFTGEFDRVFTAAAAPLQFTDGHKTVQVAQSASLGNTVVWNPGPAKCATLADMPPDGYVQMLCIEAAQIDTPVTLAAKSLLRVGCPVLLAVSTNDGLGASGENIARLMQRKHYYFVPYGQDDAAQKPQSLKADLTLLPAALEAALHGQQLQPVLREWN